MISYSFDIYIGHFDETVSLHFYLDVLAGTNILVGKSFKTSI